MIIDFWQSDIVPSEDMLTKVWNNPFFNMVKHSGVQGKLGTFKDFVFCNGVTWHTDTWLDHELTALLIVENNGFQLETNRKICENKPGEIVIFDHQKRHRLKSSSAFQKGMYWLALHFELNHYGGRCEVEQEFNEILNIWS